MKPTCSYIDSDGDWCGMEALWEIFPEGGRPYNSVLACTEHVGDMLSDAYLHRVYNIEVHE